MGEFEILEKKHPEISALVKEAVDHISDKPGWALIQFRKFSERFTNEIGKFHNITRNKYEKMDEFISRLEESKILPTEVAFKFNEIRKLCNKAAHDDEDTPTSADAYRADAYQVEQKVRFVTAWFLKRYAEKREPRSFRSTNSAEPVKFTVSDQKKRFPSTAADELAEKIRKREADRKAVHKLAQRKMFDPSEHSFPEDPAMPTEKLQQEAHAANLATVDTHGAQKDIKPQKRNNTGVVFAIFIIVLVAFTTFIFSIKNEASIKDLSISTVSEPKPDISATEPKPDISAAEPELRPNFAKTNTQSHDVRPDTSQAPRIAGTECVLPTGNIIIVPKTTCRNQSGVVIEN